MLVALAGAVVFVFLTAQFGMAPTPAAFTAIGLTFVFRVLTIAFNWRTEAVSAVKILPE